MTLKSGLTTKAEVAASRESEQSVVSSDELATDAGSQLVRANRYAFSFLSGAQNVLLDEITFAANEFVERAVAETTIYNEFLAKLAEAHSVRDYGAMCQECTKHQVEFMRRDMDRLLRHNERLFDNTMRLVETWQQNGASLLSDRGRAKE
jgi:hypothetical protein